MTDTTHGIHLTDKIQNFHLTPLTICSRTATRRLFTLMVLTPTRIRRAISPAAITTPLLIVLHSSRPSSRMGPPTPCALLHSILHTSNLPTHPTHSRRTTCPGAVISRPSHPTADTGMTARRVILTMVVLVTRRLRPQLPRPLPLPTPGLLCFRVSLITSLPMEPGSDHTQRPRCRRSSRLSPRTDRHPEYCRRNFLFRL